MAQTVTYTGSVRCRYYSDDDWMSTSEARQGWYRSNSKGVYLVGMIHFANLSNIDWSSKVITSISMSLTHGSKGKYDGSSKKFYFWPSNMQTFESVTGVGSTIVSGLSELGNFSKPCYQNKAVSVALPTDSQTLFDNMCAYLRGGNTMFALYDNETYFDSSYSTNYLAITAASITIEYEDAIVYYGKDGEWVPCIPYYGVNGAWKQCIPYYGVNGEWKQV